MKNGRVTYSKEFDNAVSKYNKWYKKSFDDNSIIKGFVNFLENIIQSHKTSEEIMFGINNINEEEKILIREGARYKKAILNHEDKFSELYQRVKEKYIKQRLESKVESKVIEEIIEKD